MLQIKHAANKHTVVSVKKLLNEIQKLSWRKFRLSPINWFSMYFPWPQQRHQMRYAITVSFRLQRHNSPLSQSFLALYFKAFSWENPVSTDPVSKRSNSALGYNGLNAGHWKFALVWNSIPCSSGWQATRLRCVGPLGTANLQNPSSEGKWHLPRVSLWLRCWVHTLRPFTLPFLPKTQTTQCWVFRVNLLKRYKHQMRDSTSTSGWITLWRRLFEVTPPSIFHSTTLDLLLQKNASKFTLHIPLDLEVSKMCQTNLRIVRLSLISFTATQQQPTYSSYIYTEIFVNSWNPCLTSFWFPMPTKPGAAPAA